MRRILYLTALLVFFAQINHAQDYIDYMQQGKYYYNKHNYISAFERFYLAYEKAGSETGKEDAETWKNNSIRHLQHQQKEMDQVLKSNDSALNYARQLIDAFYFYDDKLALAFKNGKYGYIHKNGTVVINYQYDQATHFESNTGFAKVSKNGVQYLIDTTGREYLLATNNHSLTGSTEALDLRDQYINEIPKGVFNYIGLKILLLSNNNLSSIPSGLTSLKELIYLDASNNKIQTLPDNIGELLNIRHLSLQNNLISQLPTELVYLKQLKNLNLSNNMLYSIPTNLSSLYQLIELNLDGNNLKNLPDDIGQLRSLKVLSIQNNSLKKLPESIATLYQLRTLRLDQNSITDLPVEISRLSELESLYLARNQLGYLPSEIKQLVNLKRLDLQGNRIPKLKKPLIEDWLPDCAILF